MSAFLLLSLHRSPELRYFYDYHSLVIMLVGVTREGFDFINDAVSDYLSAGS